MDIIIWCILGLVLQASAHAGRFDQGPQTFHDSFTVAPQSRNYETKDVLLYLTPDQAKALEAGGAFVRPQNNDDEPAYQAEEEEEQKEEEDADQSIEQEQNNYDQPQTQQIDQKSEIEEIFRILNKQIEDNARKAHSSYVSQVNLPNEEEIEGGEEEDGEQILSGEEGNYKEKESENPRQVPARFELRQRQRDEKYVAPSVLAKQKHQTKYNYNIRHQPNKLNSTSFQQNLNKRLEKKRGGNRLEHHYFLQNKQKFIPVEETPQEEITQKSESGVAQEGLTSILSNDKVLQNFEQHRGKLLQNELQLQRLLQELKEAPRYNNQKYAIQIEGLRENLEKQKALARAEILARTTPYLSKEETDTAKLGVRNNQAPPNNLAIFKVRSTKFPATLEAVRPIPVPVTKRSRIEVNDPVPVEVEKAVPATAPKQLYVRINNPYHVERIVPVNFTKEGPTRRPGELTIIRHIWEH